jgi:general secretion pathway protein G
MIPGTERPIGSRAAASLRAGFTIIELLLVLALIGTLSAITIPIYSHALNKARVTRAMGDIKSISVTIATRQIETGAYPASLAEVGDDQMLDPWGHPYQYLNLSDASDHGGARKDKNLVPLNSDFDLYSMGPDGASVSALTAKASRDDIVRANNGAFIGLAADY